MLYDALVSGPRGSLAESFSRHFKVGADQMVDAIAYFGAACGQRTAARRGMPSSRRSLHWGIRSQLEVVNMAQMEWLLRPNRPVDLPAPEWPEEEEVTSRR